MSPYGRVLHFGVREHAMGSILNGIALHGGTRVFGGTFLIFSDYMRPPVRLAALMNLNTTYIWTHDSIGLGEDGPTHQPIEQLASLRAIPGMSVFRPADPNETAHALRAILDNPHGPAGLALTRQNLPVLEGTSYEGVAKGGYVLQDASDGDPQVVLIATGSEVQLAVAARETLEADGVPHPRGLHALPRLVREPGRGLPRERHPGRRDRPRLGRGRRGPALVPLARHRRRAGLDRALRRQRRLPDPVREVRLHRRVRRRRRPPLAGARREVTVRPTPCEDIMTNPLADLSAAGVSIWLDDLSRQRIMSGNLASLIDEKNVVGVTSNPSIFQAALSDADHYAEQLDDLAGRGASVEDAVREITTDDVRHACDIFRGVYSSTDQRRRPGLARGRPAQRARHREDGHRGRSTSGRPSTGPT